ncbi:hypothetical protein BDZ89DRAFT_687047 [Hymenopellis radicata]|nr:hypothetical protein BDZ89DRAFT_687047 [Hymenopellis radicata]
MSAVPRCKLGFEMTPQTTCTRACSPRTDEHPLRLKENVPAESLPDTEAFKNRTGITMSDSFPLDIMPSLPYLDLSYRPPPPGTRSRTKSMWMSVSRLFVTILAAFVRLTITLAKSTFVRPAERAREDSERKEGRTMGYSRESPAYHALKILLFLTSWQYHWSQRCGGAKKRGRRKTSMPYHLDCSRPVRLKKE